MVPERNVAVVQTKLRSPVASLKLYVTFALAGAATWLIP